jgi:23S rRNA (adenine2503-C2)-methyltransferase
MREIKSRSFSNGIVYLLETSDGYPVEVTDTFFPFYTKDAVGRKQNSLDYKETGDRTERWMIGVSCMSSCQLDVSFVQQVN